MKTLSNILESVLVVIVVCLVTGLGFILSVFVNIVKILQYTVTRGLGQCGKLDLRISDDMSKIVDVLFECIS